MIFEQAILGAAQRLPLLDGICPVARQEQPERQAGKITVAFEAPFDATIGHFPSSDELQICGACPRIEDEPVVPTQEQHDMRAGVGADAIDPEQSRLNLLIGQAVLRPQAFQVDLLQDDIAGERQQVRSSVPCACNAGVELGRRFRHLQRRREGAFAEMLDQRADHPNRSRPGAVRGADRLDDVFEDGRACEEPPGAAGGPRELVVVSDRAVKWAEIFVEPKHSFDDFAQAAFFRSLQNRLTRHAKPVASVRRLKLDRARMFAEAQAKPVPPRVRAVERGW